jgi:hypothetical protein
MLAAGDRPDAARAVADHLFSRRSTGGGASTIAALAVLPAASPDHPELAAHARG